MTLTANRQLRPKFFNNPFIPNYTMKTILFYTILVALLGNSFAGRAQNIYLYYPAISEGAGPEGHEDEIPLTSIAGGFTHVSGAGPGSGRADFQDYQVTKEYDVSSTKIMRDLAIGKVTDLAEIRFYGNGGTILILKIELREVTFSSYSAGGASCGGCPLMTESISIGFRKIKIGDFEWNLDTGSTKF